MSEYCWVLGVKHAKKTIWNISIWYIGASIKHGTLGLEYLTQFEEVGGLKIVKEVKEM